jgi:hypothetical protein
MLRRMQCLALLLLVLLLSGPSCSDNKAPTKGATVPDPDASPKPAPAGAKAG